MNAKPLIDAWTPIYDGFRLDYFLVWLEGYGLFCIPNFVARLNAGKLVLYLLDFVSDADLAEIQRRLKGVDYSIAPERLTLAQIEAETGYKISG